MCVHFLAFSSVECDEKQFKCLSGECIPRRLVCDGEKDCKDDSDEMIPECKFTGKWNIPTFDLFTSFLFVLVLLGLWYQNYKNQFIFLVNS